MFQHPHPVIRAHLWHRMLGNLDPVTSFELAWNIIICQVFETVASESLNLSFLFELEHQLQVFYPGFVPLNKWFLQHILDTFDVSRLHRNPDCLWNLVLIQVTA